MYKLLLSIFAASMLVLLFVSIPAIKTLATITGMTSLVALVAWSAMQIMWVIQKTRPSRNSFARYADPDGQIDWRGCAHGEAYQGEPGPQGPPGEE